MVAALQAIEGDPVWAVGGAVRDASLGHAGPAADLDLVVEGDARPVGAALAEALGAEPRVHDRFQTVAIEIEGRAIDVVTARREHYAEPGALPEVTPSSLADDLARRDFTVNALALCLTGADQGLIADAAGGLADLESRLIRRIRSGEFVEDPSRTVRAARYAARLDFSIDTETRAEIGNSAPSLDLGSSRVAEELRRLADEPTAAAALRLLADLGVPWAIPASDAEFEAVDAAMRSPGAPQMEAWALRLGRALDARVVPSAALPGWVIEICEGVSGGAALAESLRDAPPSQVEVGALRAGEAAQVAAVAAGSAEIAGWWASGRDLSLVIDGDDLIALGVGEGPPLGRGLAAARAAALDGAAPDRETQIRIACEAAEG